MAYSHVLDIFTILFSLWYISSAERPVFVTNPTDYYTVSPTSISIECRANRTEQADLTWYKNGYKLDDEQHKAHVNYSTVASGDKYLTSVLTLHLNASTQGTFYCNASNADGWTTSSNATLGIAYLNEKFAVEPEGKLVSIGETLVLHCTPPQGMPTPSVSWTRNGKAIPKQSRVQLLDSGSLIIQNVQKADGGDYVCSANAFVYQRNSSIANVVVKQRPYFVITPADVAVFVHETVRMACRVDGDPKPSIRWRREPSSPSIAADRYVLHREGTLELFSVQPTDAGIYICEASSEAGTVEAIAQLNVISSPGFTATPPAEQSVLEGYDLQITCEASGTPKPRLRWFHHESASYFLPDILPTDDRICMLDHGQLLIRAARLSDAGTYECRASSTIGLSRSITRVTVKANNRLFPAFFGSLSPSHVETRLGDNQLALHCARPVVPIELSTAYQATQLNWFKNDQPLPGEHSERLIMRNVSPTDLANFTCQLSLRETGRSASHHMRLRAAPWRVSRPSRNIEEAPAPPTTLTVSRPTTQDAVQVSWDPVIGADFYEVGLTNNPSFYPIFSIHSTHYFIVFSQLQ